MGLWLFDVSLFYRKKKKEERGMFKSAHLKIAISTSWIFEYVNLQNVSA